MRSDFIIQNSQSNETVERQNVEHSLTGQKTALAPIGVFDSGAGGLTIVSALREQLPNENFIYFGDTARCPYGTRSESDIIELSVQGCQFLIEQGAKVIVVACNTASQASLNVLRSTFSIPFIGVVPAVKPAAQLTKNGRIGVTATNQAAKSDYLRHLIEDFAAHREVYAVGCSELVTLVERGDLDGPLVEETLRHSLGPLVERDVDVIVLGCTHFPALRTAIERVVGEHVQVIDSSSAIAKRTHTVLITENLARPLEAVGGQMHIWASGDPQHFSAVASAILGYEVTVRQALRLHNA